MGQQQLILLVLATVIVGLAIVVGIRAFTENSAKANADAMMQDAVRMANDLQAWKKKPAPFGGQAAANATAATVASDFTGATWALLGYSVASSEATQYDNLNGRFEITGTTEPLITGENLTENNVITVRVCGITDTDIVGTIKEIGGNEIGVDAACPTP